MVGTLVGAGALRFWRTRRLAVVLAPLTAALAVAGVNLASAASATTHSQLATGESSLADADDVFRIGLQLMDFMHANGLKESPPALWYDQSADPAQTGLVSLYFYSFTYLSREMPEIDDGFRNLIEARKPRHVVLLCVEPTCANAPTAMRRSGYRPREITAKKLASGSRAYWVRAYAMDWTRTE
jgi:hypothetical protein